MAWGNFKPLGAAQTPAARVSSVSPAPPQAATTGPIKPAAPWLPLLLAGTTAPAQTGPVLSSYTGALNPNASDIASYGAPLVPAADLILAGMNQAYNQTRDSMRPMQANASTNGNAGAGWNIPYGVDPVWYQQFAAEHDGKTPETVYKRDGEYAIAHALSDKAWGDQFYRTYGRPPSEYDWKASYYQRQNAFYGG